MSAGSTPPRFPPIKSRAYSASASPLHTFYHPEAESGSKARKRGLLCTLLLWLTVALVVVILFAALFLAVLFLIYRPRLPAFSVSSLSIKELAVSAASASINSRFGVTVTARNPNSKLRFEYDTPLRVSVVVGGVDVADGKFAGFVHGTKHTTVLRETIRSGGKRQVTGEEVRAVRAGVSKGVATAEVRVDGKVRALFGKLRSPAMVLQVRCKGLKAAVPGSHKSSGVGGSKCEVKFRGKVLRWTV
ncbi:hypothetical protein MLD38_007158 [Melastoma candidum]|uniref:Uncharacterized protein n=1 Tax=Melastoma candidum TaxID=119954 RepID=A0ACB9RS46_9MYRT|nr:hypothetical protein MLD38_007158 [Melastoma candidum]